LTYKVKFTSAYKRSYRRLKKRGLNISLLDAVIEELRQGRLLHKKYKDHILKGNFAGFHECHIKPNWLLIYLIEDDVVTLTLVNTGTHTDILKI
jgi:mRNA interferase YafQ